MFLASAYELSRAIDLILIFVFFSFVVVLDEAVWATRLIPRCGNYGMSTKYSKSTPRMRSLINWISSRIKSQSFLKDTCILLRMGWFGAMRTIFRFLYDQIGLGMYPRCYLWRYYNNTLRGLSRSFLREGVWFFLGFLLKKS